MTELLDYINGLSPFTQGLAASAVFAIAVMLLRILMRLLRHGGKSAFRVISRQSVIKHIIHRDFVSSGRLPEFTWGHLLIIRQALQNTIQAIAVLVFVAGVAAILSGEWFQVGGYYIAFNLLFEASSWLKDWSSEKEISAFDEEITSELLSKFPSSEAKKSLDAQQG